MKTKYFLSAALTALLAVSCTDLDVDMKPYYEEYPQPEDIEIQVNTLMHSLHSVEPWVADLTKETR